MAADNTATDQVQTTPSKARPWWLDHAVSLAVALLAGGAYLFGRIAVDRFADGLGVATADLDISTADYVGLAAVCAALMLSVYVLLLLALVFAFALTTNWKQTWTWESRRELIELLIVQLVAACLALSGGGLLVIWIFTGTDLTGEIIWAVVRAGAILAALLCVIGWCYEMARRRWKWGWLNELQEFDRVALLAAVVLTGLTFAFVGASGASAQYADDLREGQYETQPAPWLRTVLDAEPGVVGFTAPAESAQRADATEPAVPLQGRCVIRVSSRVLIDLGAEASDGTYPVQVLVEAVPFAPGDCTSP